MAALTHASHTTAACTASLCHPLPALNIQSESAAKSSPEPSWRRACRTARASSGGAACASACAPPHSLTKSESAARRSEGASRCPVGGWQAGAGGTVEGAALRARDGAGWKHLLSWPTHQPILSLRGCAWHPAPSFLQCQQAPMQPLPLTDLEPNTGILRYQQVPTPKVDSPWAQHKQICSRMPHHHHCHHPDTLLLLLLLPPCPAPHPPVPALLPLPPFLPSPAQVLPQTCLPLLTLLLLLLPLLVLLLPLLLLCLLLLLPIYLLLPPQSWSFWHHTTR